jgi:hypothetical protein
MSLVANGAVDELPDGRYVGVLRVDAGARRLSGDLYVGIDDGGRGLVFSRSSYARYLRTVAMADRGDVVELEWELYRRGVEQGWRKDGLLRVAVREVEAGAGGMTLEGVVRDGGGREVAAVRLQHVSEFVRAAAIDVRRVPGCVIPLDSGDGANWDVVFRKVGWRVSVAEVSPELAKDDDGVWSYAELHGALDEDITPDVLDREWRYTLLCVPQVMSHDQGLVRGVMFDFGLADTNRHPREGSAVAGDWRFSSEAAWGSAAGHLLQEVPAAYLRTAVHEIGHAMGLNQHTGTTFGIMNTTDAVAANALAPLPFPQNIDWSFAPEDAIRLKHMPDAWVRPGGNSIAGEPVVTDARARRRSGLVELAIRMTRRAVPLGAPVRIEMVLKNVSERLVVVPGDLVLSGGSARVLVIDPSGKTRMARSIVCCSETSGERVLIERDEVRRGMTLMWGSREPLFPIPGRYKIVVRLEVKIAGQRQTLQEVSDVKVTPARTASHRRIAQVLHRDQDLRIVGEIGGDHPGETARALESAAQHPALGPHYRVAEARRLSQPYRARSIDVPRARQLLSVGVVVATQDEAQAIEGLTKGRAASGVDGLNARATSPQKVNTYGFGG